MRSLALSDFKKPTDWLKLPLQWSLRRFGRLLIFALPKRYESPRSFDPLKAKEIVVIRRNNLGDAVVACEALLNLQRSFGHLKFTVVSSPYAAPIFCRFLPRASVFELPERLSVLHLLLGIGIPPSLREKRFDCAINLSDTFSSKALALLLALKSGFRVAVGVKGESPLLNGLDRVLDTQELDQHGGHVIQRFYRILEAAGFLHPAPFPKKLSSTPHPRPLRIAVFPECNRPESRWSIANFKGLAQLLANNNFELTFYTRPRGAQNLQEHVPKIAVLDNTTQLISAVEASDVVICSEGGVSHIASALLKPSVVMSGVAIRGLWNPHDEFHILIEREAPASLNISVQDVADAVLRLCNERPLNPDA